MHEKTIFERAQRILERKSFSVKLSRDFLTAENRDGGISIAKIAERQFLLKIWLKGQLAPLVLVSGRNSGPELPITTFSGQERETLIELLKALEQYKGLVEINKKFELAIKGAPET